MSKINIKFLEDGKWCDNPAEPIFEVKAGQEKEVSARVARLATEGGKAEYVRPDLGAIKKAEEDAELAAMQKAEDEVEERQEKVKRGRGKNKAGPTPKAEG